VALAMTLVAFVLGGCGPSYLTLRLQGQQAVVDDNYGVAAELFGQAEAKSPLRVDNLHDLGVCAMKMARVRFVDGDQVAALRQTDLAIQYYRNALEIHPGHQASMEGLNRAMELKGQFDKALRQAEWAMEFVGPSSKQQIFLANELEERGDIDGALLRHRQSIAMEPSNPAAHVAFAEFLFRHGKDEPAIKHLQVAYRLDPMNRRAAEQLIARNALPRLPNPQARNP
jgi:tetratricopeptide (TPR) repeat protein